MPAMLDAEWELWLVPLVGHLAVGLRLVNFLHATGLRSWLVHLASGLVQAVVCALPLGLLWLDHGPVWGFHPGWLGWFPWNVYAAVCTAVAVLTVCRRVLEAVRRRRTGRCRHRDLVDLGPAARSWGRGVGRPLVRVPGNQALELEVTHKEIELARLPASLAGLSIAHLSDLHFTGRLDRAFFEAVIRHTNELDADLVVLTGDLIEKTACLDWIAGTLGRLTSRYGACFVLGNHDLRVGSGTLRRLLVQAGLVDLGGRSILRQFRDEAVRLAGTELPWIGRAPAKSPRLATRGLPDGLSILLSHSPDQIGFARRNDFDLMLAGHTHGGQIVLPLVGPLVCPSRYGTKYAAGTFHEPPTVMHVSRGVSSELPLRFNCRPEISRLVLACPKTRQARGSERQLATAGR